MGNFTNFQKLAFSVLSLGMLVSCSNDLNEPVIKDGNLTSKPLQLISAPDVITYSGQSTLGNTFENRTRGEEETSRKPKAVTSDEMKKLRETFNSIDQHFNGNYSVEIEGMKLFNGFYDFNTQWLKDGNDFYVVNIVNGESMSMFKMDIRFWHQKIAYDISEDTYNNGDFTVLKYVDALLNFESENPQIHIEKEIEDISFNKYEYFVFATNPLYNVDKNDYNKYGNYPPFRYVTIDGLEEDEDWEYAYIGVYYQKSTEYSPNSPSTEKGDNKWDRIIRIAKPKNIHINEDDINKHLDEVEVNFSIQDTHSLSSIEDLVTKLSIHVRHGGDVQVKIPVGPKYFMPADDLYILQKHDFTTEEGKQNYWVYASEESDDHLTEDLVHILTYNIKDEVNEKEWTIELRIEYVMPTEIIENGYILISSQGIDEDLIDYLMKENGDGINFEIYNYFCINEYNETTGEWERVGNLSTKDDSEIRGLYSLLNKKTTIEFLKDKYPKYYINAFGKEFNEENAEFSDIQENDIIVNIIGNQASNFNYNGRGYHLNGTPYNHVYVHKDKGEADKAHPGTTEDVDHTNSNN